MELKTVLAQEFGLKEEYSQNIRLLFTNCEKFDRFRHAVL